MLRFVTSAAVVATISLGGTAPRVPAQEGMAVIRPMPRPQPVAEDFDRLRELLEEAQWSDGGDEAGFEEEPLFTSDELDELVAPIALYPDALLHRCSSPRPTHCRSFRQTGSWRKATA